MAKRILFVAYGGGHMNMLLPVIQRLRREGRHDVRVMGLTTAGQTLERLGIPYFGYRDLLRSKDQHALVTGRRLAAALGDRAKLPHEESVAYLGLSFADLEARLGTEQARARYEAEGRGAFLPLSVMERVLRDVQPDLLVATNSPRSEKAAILMARKLGIPAVCVNDLFDRREFDDRTGQPGYADRVCVFSESVRQMLLAYGRAAHEVVVTGNPAFDELADPALSDKADSLKTGRGWHGKRLIMWARQILQEHQAFYREVEDRLFEMAERHPDWHLVIRPHPNDSIRYPQLPAQASLSSQQDPLATVLAAMDVVITVSSTVGLQAVVLGKPLVALQTPEVIDVARHTPYAQMGLAIGIDDLAQLEDGIRQALGGYQPAGLVPRAGQATANVLRVIQELL